MPDDLTLFNPLLGFLPSLSGRIPRSNRQELIITYLVKNCNAHRNFREISTLVASTLHARVTERHVA